MKYEYEIQVSAMRDTVWIHCSEGSTVGRFGRMGIDLHNSVSDMLKGAPECRLCTHGQPSVADWTLFREKALEFWGVDVPADAYNIALLLPYAPIESSSTKSSIAASGTRQRN